MALALFVGGGTLGSVTPLLAIAEELKLESQISNLKFEISFWGTRTGPERTLVGAAGIPFRTIPSGKLRRYWDIRNLLDLVIVKWAFWVALIRLMRWRPSVVVGAGSFVQVPVMWAAWCLRIPVVIHQLDVRPSLANRLVAPFAQHITAVAPASAHAFGRHPVEVIGNPMRASILAARNIEARAAKRHFGFSGDRPVLLVIGGGTGAQALNELVWGALPHLTASADVIHVTGKRRGVNIPNSKFSAQGGSASGGQIPNSAYRSFGLLTDDLPYAYAAADLVVSRAGMGTITELGCLGKAMVLVPMPGTHQEENASAIAGAGAAVVWDQRDLAPKTFADRTIALIQDRALLGSLGRACAALFPSDASGRLAAVIIQVGATVSRERPPR